MCLLLENLSWLRRLEKDPSYTLFFIFIILVTHLEQSYSFKVLHLQQRNGYYYTTLSTPNFPGEFKTPFNETYIVDLQETNLPMNNSKINAYLTDVHVKEPTIKFVDAAINSNLTWNNSILFIATRKDYFEIQVYIGDLYQHHMRLKSNPNTFGFNITIEAIRNESGTSNSSCSVASCSYAGTCWSFPGESRLEFRCDCMEGFFGPKCQFGPECNPAANITMCLNGGVCSTRGTTGLSECKCPDKFDGSRCQTRKNQTINFIEDSSKNCTDTANQEVANNFKPCSRCRNLGSLHTYSQRYIVLLRNNETFNDVETTLRSRFQSNFLIASKSSTKKGLAVEVYGQKLPSNSTMYDGLVVFNARPSKTVDSYMNTTIGINKSNIKEGDEFSLTCKTVVLHSKESVIDFKWFKDGVLIQNQYTTPPRDISIYYGRDQHTELSVLFVDKVTLADKGVFTCQVTDLIKNIQTCADKSVSVMRVPNLKITPMSVSILRGESVLLTCTDAKVPHETSWLLNGKTIRYENIGDDLHLYRAERMHPHGAILRVLNAQESVTFMCSAKNLAGSATKEVRVEVLESRADRYESCTGIWEDLTEFRMSWNVTKIGQVAISPCPTGFEGEAQKKCGRSESREVGQWEPTDFSRCIHSSLIQINSTLLSIKSGFRVTETGLDVLPILVDKYIDMRKQNRTNSLLVGETDPLISLLTRILKYIIEISLNSPQTVKDSTVLRLAKVTEKVLELPHNAPNKYKAFGLISEFIKFVAATKMEKIIMQHINIETVPLIFNEEGERIVHMNKPSVSLDFEYHPIDNGILERQLRIVQFTNLLSLFNYTKDEADLELISDIVQVNVIQKNIPHPYVTKENTCYDIRFKTDSDISQKKVTCGSIDTLHYNFTTNVCTANATSAFTVTCCCNRFEVFAVFAVREQIVIPPQANEIFSPPPNWIATSGCLVCLVLVLRSLTATLMQRVFDVFYFMTTGGIILSMILLLILILSAESRAVALIYLLLTLFIKSLRIWRQLLIYDIHEMYPWLENVTRWIPLTVILITLTLPLLTVFFVESIQPTIPDEFILQQSSPVLLTFFTTFCVSNLIIFAVHYKTYLRVSAKSTHSSTDIRDKSDLNQNLIGTLILMVQILSVLLYWNLKQHIFFHYFFAVSNLFVGLSWRSAQKDKSNRSPKRGSSQSHQALQSSDGCNNSNRSMNLNTSTHSKVYGRERLSTNGNDKNVELQNLGTINNQRYSSPRGDPEENDHDTIVTTTKSVSTVGKYGQGSTSDYYGDLPAPGKCFIIDDGHGHGHNRASIVTYAIDDGEYVQPS